MKKVKLLILFLSLIFSQNGIANQASTTAVVKEITYLKKAIMTSKFDDIDRCYWMARLMAAHNEYRVVGLTKKQARDLDEVILVDYPEKGYAFSKSAIIGMLDVAYGKSIFPTVAVKKMTYMNCVMNIIEKEL